MFLRFRWKAHIVSTMCHECEHTQTVSEFSLQALPKTGVLIEFFSLQSLFYKDRNVAWWTVSFRFGKRLMN